MAKSNRLKKATTEVPTLLSGLSEEDLVLWKKYIESPVSFNFMHNVRKPVAQINHSTGNTIDLHGMTLQQAYHATVSFITAHKDLGTRHVLVICGKGEKISKEIVHWCMLIPGVSGCNPIIDTSGEAGSYKVTFFKKKR